MKGEVLLPFVTQLDGRKIRPSQGDIIEIPPNVDWVTAGFVKPIEEEGETAVPKPKAKKGKS